MCNTNLGCLYHKDILDLIDMIEKNTTTTHKLIDHINNINDRLTKMEETNTQLYKIINQQTKTIRQLKETNGENQP